jgi:peptidoglycan/LPS O-acetylase OafA/YrhL
VAQGGAVPGMPSTRPSSGTRLPGIEGLRGLAAVSIVLVHTWSTSMPHGVVLGIGSRMADTLSTLSVGVTLFFTLSGFLLYRQFVAPIARGTSRLPISAYLHNRVLRIAPAYWVILLLTAVVIGSVSLRAASGQLDVGRLTDPLAFGQAALLIQQYHPGTVMIGIGPAWSLAVELVFYLALPLLALGAARLARRASERRERVLVLLGPPLLLLLIGLSGKAAAAYLLPGGPLAGYDANWHSVIERSFWAQADLFSFGMVIAVLHVEASDGRLRLPPNWRRAAVAMALLVFLPCAWTMHRGEQSYLLQNTGEALAIALAFAAIVFPDPSLTRPLRAVRVLESRAFVAVGLVSYSLFLWHYPLIWWLRDHGLTLGGGWGDLLGNVAIVAVLAGALSALTYRYVELPALRHKRSTRASPRSPGRPLTAGSAAAEALAPAGDPAIRLSRP